jgi:RNA polymerase sigma-70 factor, ECF subfamily
MQSINNNNQDLMLITKIQQGDRNAFGVLVNKYQYKILKLINRYIKDSDESLDLVQEVFMKAYKAIASFRKESSFFTWLYKIALNTIKSYLIDKHRHLPDCSFDLIENEPHKDKDFNTPDNLILCDELETIFFTTVDNLPEELKIAIKLREMHEMSYEEIAVEMQCPVGTVRSRIFRAREAIEKKITNKKTLH